MGADLHWSPFEFVPSLSVCFFLLVIVPMGRVNETDFTSTLWLVILPMGRVNETDFTSTPWLVIVPMGRVNETDFTVCHDFLMDLVPKLPENLELLTKTAHESPSLTSLSDDALHSYVVPVDFKEENITPLLKEMKRSATNPLG